MLKYASTGTKDTSQLQPELLKPLRVPSVAARQTKVKQNRENEPDNNFIGKQALDVITWLVYSTQNKHHSDWKK